MKKTKKGFSLAELLIAMGIVSVVATLGFSIAKRGIENAYDIYIYTGYRGITTAIGNATGRGIYIYENMANFKKDVAETLNAKQEDGKIKAPNGIFYTISSLGTTNEKRYYLVNMEVPAVKKNNVNRRTICLAYAPDDDWSILIPVDIGGCTSTIPNIYDRMDLLPFYLDDGYTGRKMPSNNNAYVPRKFVTARQALCKVHGSINVAGKTISCTGVDVSNAGNSFARIKLTHPQKAN